MPSEWHTVPAETFCTSVRDGTHDSPKPASQGRFLVTSRHITSGQLDLANAYLISQEDFDAINRRSKVDRWDVLLSMIGTVGEPCLVKEEPNFAIKNIGLFKSKGEYEGKWLYYYLRSPYAQQIIREQSRGTTQAYIPLGALREFPVLVPDDPREMQAIACILGALDDKIELNRRMNKTLEGMARAIFKSWFVDFDPVWAKLALSEAEGIDSETLYGMTADTNALFPDAFIPSELGLIPEGWKVGTLLEQAELISGGTPKTSRPDYWGGDILWASAKDVSQCSECFLVSTERTITSLGLGESSAKMVEAFSTVVVARGATTGRFVMLGSDMAMNQTCYALRSHFNCHFALNCQIWHVIRDLVHAAHGSVFDTITTRTFRTSLVLLPPKDILRRFDEIVDPIFEMILCNQEESQTLTQLRDTLLPKLISGELSVPDAEKIVARTL